MKKWLWLALIPSLVFAETRPCTLRQDAVYVDVHPDKVILCAEDKEIAASELLSAGNDFEQLIQDIERERNFRYPILVLRPGSEKLQPILLQIIRKYDVELGIEPWETGRPISRTELKRNWKEAIHGTAPTLSDLSPDSPSKPETPSYAVDVQADRITLLQDNITVMVDELDTPGNPFETLVDQLEAEGGNTLILFQIDKADKIKCVEKMFTIIQQRAPKLSAVLLKEMEDSVPFPTPLEAQIQGKNPVFFECRNNQLFSISLQRLKKASEDKTAELREAVDGDENQFFKSAAATTIEVDGHQVDFTYSLLGKVVLTADETSEGYSFESPSDESDETWFGSQLAELDPDTQFIIFFVRPNSFNIYRKARQLTWYKELDSSCQLIGENEPIQLGLNGSRIYAQ